MGSIEAPESINTLPNIWTGVTFRVLDAAGEADEGVAVDFELSETVATGAELQAATVTSNSFGLATAMVRAPLPAAVVISATAEGRDPATGIVAVGLPTPGATIYSTCGGSDDCTLGEACVPVGTSETGGALCTVSCAEHTDCPTNSFCVVVAESVFCMQSCSTDTDCQSTSRCVTVDEDGSSSRQLCAPNDFGP